MTKFGLVINGKVHSPICASMHYIDLNRTIEIEASRVQSRILVKVKTLIYTAYVHSAIQVNDNCVMMTFKLINIFGWVNHTMEVLSKIFYLVAT